MRYDVYLRKYRRRKHVHSASAAALAAALSAAAAAALAAALSAAALAPHPPYAATVTARPDNRRVLHLVDDGMLGQLRHLG